MTVGRAYCNKPKLLGSTEWVKDALSESAKTHFNFHKGMVRFTYKKVLLKCFQHDN